MEQVKDKLRQQDTIDKQGTTVCLEIKIPSGYINGLVWGVQTARGSGFFVAPDKIVTNVHVLAGATKVTAMCDQTEEPYTIEGIIAFDDIDDLAVLKIAEERAPFILGDSNTVRKGDQVRVLGYPKKKVSTVEGSVHSIRNSGKHLWLNFEVSEGNSGGPVLNVKGEVIAVATNEAMSFDNSSPNRGRSISSNVLRSLLEKTGEVESLDVWQKRSRIRAYVAAYEGDDNRKQGEYKEAIDLYDSALKLNPDLTDIYNNRGVVKMSVGRYDEAFTDALTALRLKPEKFSFIGIGAFLAWNWEIVKVLSRRIFLRIIRNILGQGFWLAIQTRVKCSLAKARTEQGNIAEARNLYQMGIENFTEAINQRPKKAKFYNERGWTKYLLGKLEAEEENEVEADMLFQAAISDSEKALQLELKKPKYRSAFYHTRGAAKAGLGDHRAAIEDFDESIRLNPKKALFYQDRGLSKQALGQHEAAEADFAKAKELDPKFKQNWKNKPAKD